MFGLLWKVLAGVATVSAGIAAQKALASGWRVATGREPPERPESPETGLLEAVAFAAVSGALLNLARVLATRQAAKYYARRAGTLPRELSS